MKQKKIMALVITLVLCFSSVVESSERDNVRQLCRSMSNMGHMIMERRQAGAKMADMVESIAVDDDKSARIMERIIIAAFEEKAHKDPRKKQQAIVDFENDVYKMCLKNF